METTFIIVFAALATVFLVLWLDARSLKELSERLTNELRGIDDTLGRVGHQLSGVQEALGKLGEKKLETETGPAETSCGAVTVKSVRDALLESGIPEDKIDMHEEKRIWFTIGETNYSVNVSNLPFLSFELGFNMDEKEDDVALMEKAARSVTNGMYIAKLSVCPDEGYYLAQADMIAESYPYLRDNIKRYIRIVNDACHRFDDEYKKLKKEKQDAVHNAINTAMLAAQSDGSGKKIPS